MKSILRFIAFALPLAITTLSAQPTPDSKSDVSNKALITTLGSKNAASVATLHKMADVYNAWRNHNHPVGCSESGLHTWDNRLTDYSPAKVTERADHVRKLLEQVRALT